MLARAPVAGEAKTRLAPRLGADGAARLHARLVRHTLTQARASGLTVTLWCSPDCDHPFFEEAARDFGVACAAQCAGDIGARMAHAFAAMQAPTLLVGTDCPIVDAALLLRCAQALQHADAVFLPAEDGGYGLVGLNAPHPALFAPLQWGGADVMAQTRARARALGLALAEPATVWDVDRPQDVDRLERSGLLTNVSAG